MTRFLLAFAAVCTLSTPLAAQDLSLKKDKINSDLMNDRKMKKNAGTATRGYYDAMIKGDYEAAATYVHPFLVGTLQTSMGDAIRKLKPKVQTKAVEKLGLKSLTEFDALSHAEFFKLWAASDYGYAAATLSNPKVAARYRIEGIHCTLGKYCDVTVDVRGFNEGGKINSTKSILRAAPANGNWRVGAQVKVKKAKNPADYKGPKRRKAQREKAKREAALLKKGR